MLTIGRIVKINSDVYTVNVDNSLIECKAKGKFRYKKISPLVGDNVKVDKEKKVILEIEERTNCLLRPPVANIDKALIVTSIKEPDINLSLLDKLISIVIINKIEPVIVFSKLDLCSHDELNTLKEISNYYKKIGIKVFTNNDIKEITRYLKNSIVTVCGQTGAGKSSLINKFDNNLNLDTNAISKALGRGVHTTRIVELFKVDDFYIVDTPGFSKIDFNKYTIDDIKLSYPEFNSVDCKYKDCSHEKEDGCEIIKRVKAGFILQSRYDNYLRFIKEIKNDRSKFFKK